MKVCTLLQLRQGLSGFCEWSRGTEPRFSLKESTLSPDSNGAGYRKCEQETTINLQERIEYGNASLSSLWVCSFVSFTLFAPCWKLSFFWGEGHPRRMCHVQPEGWKPTKLPFLAVALLVLQLWAKSLVQSFRLDAFGACQHGGVHRECCGILSYLLSYKFICWNMLDHFWEAPVIRWNMHVSFREGIPNSEENIFKIMRILRVVNHREATKARMAMAMPFAHKTKLVWPGVYNNPPEVGTKWSKVV